MKDRDEEISDFFGNLDKMLGKAQDSGTELLKEMSLDDQRMKRAHELMKSPGVPGALAILSAVGISEGKLIESFCHAVELGIYIGIKEEEKRSKTKVDLTNSFDRIDEMLNGRQSSERATDKDS